MEPVRIPEPPTAVICQFARLGDLAQTLPLINKLARRYRLLLYCDRSVESWAKAIPNVAEVISLDTRAWRRRCLAPAELFTHSWQDLEDGFRARIPGVASPVVALNDHPVVDALLGWICFDQSDRWLTHRLLLVRSYIRLIAGRRRLNRIHLTDLWVSLTAEDDGPAGIPALVNQTGTRFANPVWEEWNRRKSRRLWGLILGSGAKSRRLEPEDFARIWSGVPATFRPALVLLGGSGEEALGERFLRSIQGSTADILNLVGRCSPEKLIAVLHDLELVIGVDTGPLHWAAAVGTKVLGFYFAEAGFYDTGPYGEGHFVLVPRCPEYPCHPLQARQCGYLCRDAFRNYKEIAAFLSSMAKNDNIPPDRSPQDLLLYRSLPVNGWNHYEPLEGSVRDETAEDFAAYAKQILRGAPPEMRGALSRSVALLRQAWEAEVMSLSFPRSVSASDVDRIRQEAIAKLTSDVNHKISDENRASERRLFSFEPAGVGA
jgi:ADP-heptose:LPS heptosyltransferase